MFMHQKYLMNNSPSYIYVSNGAVDDGACSAWTFHTKDLKCMLYARLQPFDTDPTRSDSMVAG